MQGFWLEGSLWGFCTGWDAIGPGEPPGRTCDVQFGVPYFAEACNDFGTILFVEVSCRARIGLKVEDWFRILPIMFQVKGCLNQTFIAIGRSALLKLFRAALNQPLKPILSPKLSALEKSLRRKGHPQAARLKSVDIPDTGISSATGAGIIRIGYWGGYVMLYLFVFYPETRSQERSQLPKPKPKP